VNAFLEMLLLFIHALHSVDAPLGHTGREIDCLVNPLIGW
jgi:hypothetical protein